MLNYSILEGALKSFAMLNLGFAALYLIFQFFYKDLVLLSVQMDFLLFP